MLGDHPATSAARQALLAQYVDSSTGKLLDGGVRPLEVERLLIEAQAGPDAAHSRAATAILARMLVALDRPEEAAVLYRRLAGELADAVCLAGKTGRQLFAELPADSPVRRVLAAPGPWPQGVVEKQTRTGAASRMAQNAWPLNVEARNGLFDELRLEAHRRQSAEDRRPRCQRRRALERGAEDAPDRRIQPLAAGGPGQAGRPSTVSLASKPGAGDRHASRPRASARDPLDQGPDDKVPRPGRRQPPDAADADLRGGRAGVHRHGCLGPAGGRNRPRDEQARLLSKSTDADGRRSDERSGPLVAPRHASRMRAARGRRDHPGPAARWHDGHRAPRRRRAGSGPLRDARQARPRRGARPPRGHVDRQRPAANAAPGRSLAGPGRSGRASSPRAASFRASACKPAHGRRHAGNGHAGGGRARPAGQFRRALAG